MGYKSVTLSVDRWPALDRGLWEQALRGGDPLEPEGVAAHWSENTRRQVLKDYGRFLFWLSRNDMLDGTEMPGPRLTKARLAGYLAHLQTIGMASTSLLSRMRGLRQAIGALDPATDVSLLKALCARLKHRAVPRRQKHRRIADPALLIDKAMSHYDALMRSSREPGTRNITYARDALMLAFLAYHPIRLANFTGLRLGQHVIDQIDGFHLRLSAAETKEGRPYECAIAGDLLFHLRHYLEHVRPWLLDGETSDHLWVSMRGGALSASAIYYQINKITRRLIGHSINPHLIRDCALTALAEHAPENVRVGARLLGHADLRTGELHYNHASAFSAQRAHLELIRAIRGGA